MKNFDTLGIMIDCSRGAVYTVEAIKKFIVIMSKMGYNMLSLYTEDTYEIDGEPYFGAMRGRYTRAELNKLDMFAKENGVELVPCIQTLGHLGKLRQHAEYEGLFDIADVLLADDERVYALIRKMFESISSSFSSRLVNIGMDEAAMIGLGRYKELHGECNKYDILKRHLFRVVEIAKEYGFTPMMWSDMFFRFATAGRTYRVDKLVITDAEREMLPPETELVYWDYYTLRRARYDMMFENHRLLAPADKLWYAGGIWTWTGFVPHNEATLRFVEPAIASCIDKGIRKIFFTMWGDNGGECSIFSVLPAMYDIARLARGDVLDDKCGEEFSNITGIKREELLLLELPDKIPPREVKNPYNCWEYLQNPSKYMLYNDPLIGKYDSTVRGGEGKLYEEYEERLLPFCRDGEYALHFRASKALCSVLRYKYELGVRTRDAYKNGKEALASLIPDYDNAIIAAKEFHEAYRALWFSEKKPQGFETHDIRIAGVETRLVSAKKRIEDFISGRISVIEELEEPTLGCDGGGSEYKSGPLSFNSYSAAIGASGI